VKLYIPLQAYGRAVSEVVGKKGTWKAINTKFPPRIYNIIKSISEKTGMDMSDIVRQAVLHYLAEKGLLPEDIAKVIPVRPGRARPEPEPKGMSCQPGISSPHHDELSTRLAVAEAHHAERRAESTAKRLTRGGAGPGAHERSEGERA